jgi:glycosyltransferase involved in cell wall biosynthesis
VNVLLIHNTYRWRGGEDIVVEQERGILERAGHKVTTYYRSNWEIQEPSVLHQPALLSKIIWSRDCRHEVAAVLEREKPDIIHIHNTFLKISPSVYSACADAGIPVIQTLHNYRFLCPAAYFFRHGHVCEECADHGLWRSVQHGCYRKSRSATAAVAVTLAVHRKLKTLPHAVTRYIANTEFARQKFIAAGFPADRVKVKPNFLYPDPGKHTGRGRYAVFAGRLSPEKGLRRLLEAWAGLQERIPLHIIGDGPLRQAIEKQAAGLPDVRLDGSLTHDETLQMLKSALFLVCPSEWYENFPMVIVEAFACSTPVICPRLGAMQEVVCGGRTGLHFDNGDTKDLIDKVTWAWRNPEKMHLMGEAARQEFETKYTAEQNYNNLMAIYEDALHSLPQAGSSTESEKAVWPRSHAV